ncbi:MAG: Wzz/FepE/Etk N-terminal domain-containing protein [Thermodesulfovibrionales bacterium]
MSSLDRFIEIVRRRKYILIASVLIFALIPLVLSFFYKPVYKASSHLRILLHESQSQYPSDMPDRVGAFEYADKNKVDNTFFAMLKNPKSLKRVIAALRITDRKGRPLNPDKFVISNDFSLFFKQEGIGVDVVESGEVIELIAYAHSPKRAEQIANAAVDSFTELYADIYRDEAKVALSAMEERLKFVTEELRKIEKRRYELLKSKSMVDITSEMDQLVKQYYSYIDLLNQNKRSVEEGKKSLQEIEATIRKIPELYKSDQVIERNPLIDDYKKQIVSLETSIAKMRGERTEQHPEVVTTRKQIEELREAIHKELDRLLSNETFSRNSYYTDLEKRLWDTRINLAVYTTTANVLNKIIDSTRNTMFGMKEVELGIKQIDREQSTMSTEYTSIVKGLGLANVLLTMKPTNLAVLNYADASVIQSPHFPNRKKLLALSVFLGLTMGFALILLEEYSDRSLKDLAEAGRLLPSRPLLGLPGVRKKGSPFSAKEESFETLIERDEIRRAAWNIISGAAALTGGKLPRSLLFTGAEPGVGTTTAAYVTARELALQGKRVLFFNISSKELRKEERKRETLPAVEGFPLKRYVLESGVPGLSVLDFRRETGIGSAALVEDLPEQLRQMDYDCIIIDSDALSASNDSLFAARFAEAVLVVARFRGTSKDAIEAALGHLGGPGSKVSVLVNRI